MICLALMSSCSKDGDDDNPFKEKQADVYVAGSQTIAGKDVATLWKNGTAIQMANTSSSASDVFISGNDVYVAGGEKLPSTKFIARLWKNGTATDLVLAGTDNSYAQAVLVSGSDVYVGGYETISGVRRAKIWKNGKLRYTFPKNTIQMIYEIDVQGRDIYVVGYPSEPSYWKITETNQELIPVPELGWAHGICVNGSDVYVTGNKDNIAKYVKNSTTVNLTNGVNYAYCSSIFIDGDDVYAVGGEEEGGGNMVAKYWKNGTPTSLTDGSNDNSANSVFVWNEKVYVTGKDGESAFLWENGKLTKLADEGTAMVVFVADRP